MAFLQADLENSSVEAMDVDQASSDLRAISSTVSTILKVAWINISSEGSALLDASFAQLVLADFMEVIGKTKEGLRTFDTQEGKRDDLGRKNKTEETMERESDPKVQWKKGMDAAKGAGSQAIGLGQEGEATVERSAHRRTDKAYEACIKVRVFVS